MKCPTKEQLISLLTQTATKEEYTSTYNHVQSCNKCEQWINEQTELVQFIKTTPEPKAPEYLHKKIMTAINKESGSVSLLSKIKELFTFKKLHIAAPVFAGICLMFLVYSENFTTTTIKSGLDTNLQALLTGKCTVTASAGKTINVMEDRSIRLNWYDKGVVAIEGPASCAIDTNGLNLKTGKVTCLVKPGKEGFFVSTPFQTATVIGTCFSVTASNSGGLVTVFEGKVSVLDIDLQSTELLLAGDSSSVSLSTPDIKDTNQPDTAISNRNNISIPTVVKNAYTEGNSTEGNNTEINSTKGDNEPITNAQDNTSESNLQNVSLSIRHSENNNIDDDDTNESTTPGSTSTDPSTIEEGF